MKLLKIRLKNFRQFYGDQVLDIAQPGKKNVTLIHAENGVGKTTLLNAVLWALYEETSRRFEQRDKILNFEARKEGDATACVELTFEHEGRSYLASRSLTLTNGDYRKMRFEVMRIGTNGVLSPPLPNPDAFINTVVPWPMAPNFFFDGEQAESFSSEKDGDKNVADAIRDILGCTLLETSIKDLEYIERSFNKELGNLEGEEQIRQLEREIEQFESQRDKCASGAKELQENIASYEAQIAGIDEKLRDAHAAAEIQAKREGKENELGQVRQRVKDAESETVRWIATKGIAAVAKRLTQESLSYIDEESLKGRIPSPYNEDFVAGLLEAQTCICARPLHVGSPEWRAVQGLLKNAANAEVMGRVVRARSRLGMLKETASEATKVLNACEERLARLVAQRRDLEREVEELSKKLEDLPVAEIRERERARKKLMQDLDAAKASRIRLLRDAEYAEQEIKGRNTAISELALRNLHAQKLLRRKLACAQAKELLAVVLKNYESEARVEIEKAVNFILEKTARKAYKMEVDENFGLRLLFADSGDPTPKSGGENQLMSLAFIAALVQFAERRTREASSELLIPATVAPLILDSPFGQLDDRYREDTAKFVPEMAPQVVLLVSTSQGKAEVINAIESRVGAEYVLIAENRGSKGDKRQDYITVNGKRQATTLFNCARTMTRIEKV